MGEQMTRAEWEMLAGLANVVQRVDGSAPLRYLTAAEVSDVLNGGGDQYRRSANTNDHSPISGGGITGAALGVQVAESGVVVENF